MFSKTTIIGRLGNDPKFATSKAGKDYAQMSVGVTTGYGEHKQTDWFSVIIFGNQSKACSQYLSKGSLVCVTGTVHADAYEGKDGKPKATLSMIGDSITFLNQKGEHSNEQTAPISDPVTDSFDIPF